MRIASRPLLASLAVAMSIGALMLGGCANDQAAGVSRLGSENGRYGRWGNGQQAASNMLKNEVGDLVYFSSDSSELTPEAQQTLTGQARFLQQYQEQSVTIEGHADERGTREYNIALGARRAASVRNYLISQGVNGGRVRTISYGKERPIAVCDDISCWSQNRRAQTVLSATAVSQNLR